MLENLTHRGAVGADPLMGDGAGMLVQIPDRFFREEMAAQGFDAAAGRPVRRRPSVHAAGRGAARAYRGRHRRGRRSRKACRCSASATCRSTIPRCPRRPTSRRPSRSIARSSSAAAPTIDDDDEFERRLYHRCARSSPAASMPRPTARDNGFYVVSLSARTIVYKGMFLAYQVGAYYKDLTDPRFEIGADRSSTSASRPTPSRPGSWRIPTAWSPTTARSTRCAATSTGWRRARRRSISRAVRQRHLQALADLLRGPVGHRLLRQRARIPVRRAAIRWRMR